MKADEIIRVFSTLDKIARLHGKTVVIPLAGMPFCMKNKSD